MIIVEVSGGIVQCVYGHNTKEDVIIADWDSDSEEEPCALWGEIVNPFERMGSDLRDVLDENKICLEEV